MAEGRRLIKLALFGAPVKHSKSPSIHAEFARQLGLYVSYEAIHTEAGQLREALAAFEKTGGTGANITLPLKREAMELANTVSDAVRLSQAANVLVREGEGRWAAHNTDGAGLMRDMAEAGWPIAGQRIAVLGAGGAAAGILAALLEAGPSETLIINRTVDKAVQLAARHADLGAVTGAVPGAAGQSGFDLVINATSVGHEGRLPTLEAGLFGADGACYDLNYGPAADPLRQWCQGRGIPYRDGLGMLVEQAAESFTIWTGYAPDTGPVLEFLRGSQGG